MYFHLFKVAMKDLLRPGRVLTAAFLALTPAMIALAWRIGIGARGFPKAEAYNTLEAGLVFGFALVILTVMFATGVVSQEVEQKTIVYLLTRPVPRAGILLSRFAAALAMVIATTWVATLALAITTYGLFGLHRIPLGRDLFILAVGALAYGAVFLFVATFITRPLLWGLLYLFGWEWWVPSLPGDFKMASLMAYLRVLAPHASPEAETMDLNSLLSSLNPTEISSRVSWEVLLTVIVICLIGAVWVFSHRQYVPRDDAV